MKSFVLSMMIKMENIAEGGRDELLNGSIFTPTGLHVLYLFGVILRMN